MTESTYRTLDKDSIARHLSNSENVVAILGDRSAEWSVSEIGDGNLNLVFRVESSQGSVIAKQALPYLRARGEGWPLPLSRAWFEQEALAREEQRAPEMTPALIHADRDMALTVMEDLSSHIILRKGLVLGRRYPTVAKDLGEFLARTLFRGSDFCLDAATKRADVALFSGNSALCAVTEARVFTEPYVDAELNRWTRPQLDDVVVRIRNDDEYKAAIHEMKLIFMTRSQSLLHGDLHSGSVMVTDSDTRVIDPEFAFYGPMSFDVGALLGNYLLAYMAQPGQTTPEDDRAEYAEWILTTVISTWSTFVAEFRRLWKDERTGALFSPGILATDSPRIEQSLNAFLNELFAECLGFAAAKMTRRVIGAAHVEDLESITDSNQRAECEVHVLMLARALLLGRRKMTDIDEVADIARDIRLRAPEF